MVDNRLFGFAANESELLLDLLDGVGLFVDEAGLIAGFGRRASAVFGYEPDDVLGRPLAMLISASSRESLRRLVATAAEILSGREHEGSDPVRMTAVRSDGSQFEVHAACVPVGPSSKPQAVVVMGEFDRAADVASVKGDDVGSPMWEALLCHSKDVALVLDSDGRVRHACGGSSEILGLEPGELVGEVVFDLLPEDEREAARDLFDRALAGDPTGIREFRMYAVDGSVRWVEVTGVAQRVGSAGSAVVNVRDVTERNSAIADRALALSAVEAADTAFAITDAEGRIESANDALVRMWRYASADDLIGRSARDVLFADSGQVARCMARVQVQGRCSGEMLAQRSDGTQFDVRYAVTAVEGGTGLASALLLVMSDVSELRQLEQAVTRAESQVALERDKFRHLIDGVSDAVLVVTADLVLAYANPAALKLLGEECCVVGSDMEPSARQWLDTESLAAVSEQLRVLADGCSVDMAFPMWLDPAAEPRHVEATITNLSGTASIRGIVVHLRDVTDKVEQLERITALALTDEVTGLANRTALMARLADDLVAAAATGDSIGVLFLDVDRFKSVNDTHGHSVGDDLLRLLADRLRSVVRDDDFVARFGGDEFVMLHHIDPSRRRDCSSHALAERVLFELSRPASIGGEIFTPSVSVGVTVSDDNSCDADALLRDADTALYQAKAQGGSSVATFKVESRLAVQRRFDIEQGLKRAIAGNELNLAYQPIVDLMSGEVVGCEALSRWTHSDLGDIPPSEFIAVAEDIGCASQLGQWVIERACRDLSDSDAWNGPAPGYVSLNVTAGQLDDQRFVPALLASLTGERIDPARIVLELTERMLLADTPTMRHALDELRSHGVRLSLDDFGTGYSSLAYLARYPIDIIKIDRSFIADMDRQGPLIEAIIAMARALDMSVIAEGIETVAQLEQLLLCGCDYGQGFLFARPSPSRSMPMTLAASPTAFTSRPTTVSVTRRVRSDQPPWSTERSRTSLRYPS